LDDDEQKWGTRVAGLPVFGPLTAASRWPHARFVNALGSPANFWQRDSFLKRAGIAVGRLASAIHPRATISSFSTLGSGVVVYPGAVICGGTRLGDQVVLLANTVVNHDTQIGDCTILATNVTVSGKVRIGHNCYIGAAASIRERVTVGDRVLVGMGSVILKDVLPGTVMVGNPARSLRVLPASA
jgi:sugar O-acyltransferase (sialic acid O-acetyltransferase NeuD family)